MTYNFCYLCGATTKPVSDHDTTHWQCTQCAQTYYANPKPATAAVLVDENYKVVVAVRARDPHKGRYDLPGGFIDDGEYVEQALARELIEELGLAASDYSGLTYLSSGVDLYPWGHETYSVVAMAFTARIDSSVSLRPQDDVAALAEQLVKLHKDRAALSQLLANAAESGKLYNEDAVYAHRAELMRLG